jgi:predicted secreted protein with PEFG-CTERM motif
MKSKPIGVILGVLALVAILGVAPAFGQSPAEIDMTKGAGSASTAPCVAAKNCWSPNPLTIEPGTTVTWKNTDTVSHYVTSGVPTDNTTGLVFDSGNLIKPAGTYVFTFANAGTYNYFCTVHPWMTGQVIVAATSGGTSTMLDAMSTDGTTKVAIVTTPGAPTGGQSLSVALTFTNASGSKIQHQNYAITVTQGNTTLIDNATGHTHTGDDIQGTQALASSDPVDIKITLKGVGLPGTDPATWTGPTGDVISFHVIPEFGSIVPIILAIAIISIIVFTAKSRAVPRL